MRALALFSGGLDSMLAVKLLTNQGLHVKALYIDIGFGGTKIDTQKLKNRANMAGGDFELIDVRNRYLQEVLFAPKYGYGKHFNPCIDCHGFMFRVALNMLKDEKADFVISGEVVGQRPMSQRNEALKSVSKLAQDEQNLILRPLCAKNLPITTPEQRGWVDREKLLNISGRGREKQLKLAKDFGFEDYESPGGGCLLTLEVFASKIKDFIKYDNFETQDIDLLKFGRHLRLNDNAKLIIGRNQDDNEELRKIKNSKYSFVNLVDTIGPVSLLSNNATDDDITLATRLILTYAKTQKNSSYSLNFRDKTITQTPFNSKEEAHKYFVF